MVCPSRQVHWLLVSLFISLFAIPGTLFAENTPAGRVAPRAAQSLLLDITLAGSRLISVGERGHVLTSEDAGETWTLPETPTRAMLTAVSFPDSRRGWAVGHDGTIIHSLDGGKTWVLQREDLDPAGAPPLLDVHFDDALHGIAVGAFNTFLVTSDGGITWADRSADIDNLEEFHLNAVTADGRGNWWVAGEAGLLYRSRDNGNHWKQLDSPYEGSWFGISYGLRSNRLLVFGLRGNIRYSDDHGASWVQVDSHSDRSIAGGGFISERYALLAGAVGTLLLSTDAASNFTRLSLPERVNLSAATIASGTLIAVGQGGIHRVPVPGETQ